MTSNCKYQDERETLLPLVVNQADSINEDDVHEDRSGNHTSTHDDHEQKIDKVDIVQNIKYLYSLALLALCIRLILAGITAGETPVAQAFNPMATMVITLCLIMWLAVLEGLQGCLVGLQPIDPKSYGHSHPLVLQCTTIAHYGDNLNRFIVGRQFWVVLIIFALNMCCTLAEDSVILVVPGVPVPLVNILLGSGLGLMIVTVILGQLSAEVNATHSMLDYMNTRVMIVSTWLCLAIEFSGLLHSVYLFQHIFEFFDTSNSSQSKTSTNKTPASCSERIFYWIRVFISLSILVYAMTATIAALLEDETTMFSYGIFSNGVLRMIILFGLIVFLGIQEAMQIALFAVVNLSPDLLVAFPQAQANCKLAFSGKNFQAFLIGRQICVTISMFLLARITTTDVQVANKSVITVLHMSDSLQEFFNTGLPGALITTIVASLAFRIIASCFPIHFMANPLVYPTIRLCLLLEASGVFSAAWVVAKILQKLIGFKNDQVYLGVLGQRGCEASTTPSKKKNSTSPFKSSGPLKSLGDDDDDSCTETDRYSLSSSSAGDVTYSRSSSRESEEDDEMNHNYGATL